MRGTVVDTFLDRYFEISGDWLLNRSATFSFQQVRHAQLKKTDKRQRRKQKKI
jgi:hypothetical protein